MEDLFNKFFTGINYWSSSDATRMWRNYDEKVIEKDMQLLRDAGVTALRVFPAWNDFQPITAFSAPGGIYEYGMNDEIRPDTEAGRAGVSEEMCQHFENFCDIADKYGMKLIVGVLTGHMSFANLIPPALTNLNIVTDPTAIRWEIKFIKYFVNRFKHHKAIAGWDLGNEVDNFIENSTKDEFYVWTTILAECIRSCDNTRPLISGIGFFEIDKHCPNLYDLSDVCDMNTVHTYNLFMTKQDPVNTMKSVLDQVFKCRLSEDIAKRPTFLQEFGATGYTNCSAKGEAEFYRASVLSTMSHGFYGTMYWCAFDQGQFTFPPYNWNNIGSDYGFYDRDLKIKPIAETNIEMKSLIDLVGDKLPKYSTDCVIIAPREEQLGLDNLRSAFMLAKRSNLDAQLCYALDPIPDAPLYIFPSVEYNKAIPNTRLNELLGKVSEGATLYVSLGSAHFRSICDMAGVILENRADVEYSSSLNLNGKKIPFTAPVAYDIIPNGCEVLASDENGKPMFVKNNYGKGKIYVSFAPIEAYLAKKKGAFYDEDTPDYEDIYREISKDKNNRISDCDSKFIRFTEHTISDNEKYLFAINYHNKVQTGKLMLSEDYDIEVVWGKDYQNGEITLDPCDGILLKATKR